MRRTPTTASNAVPAITPNTIPTISPALSPPEIAFKMQLLGIKYKIHKLVSKLVFTEGKHIYNSKGVKSTSQAELNRFVPESGALPSSLGVSVVVVSAIHKLNDYLFQYVKLQHL